MSTDAIVLLRDDHKQIKGLFRQFQDAGPKAVKTKAKIVDKIIVDPEPNSKTSGSDCRRPRRRTRTVS
jgi:hypothetical protein